MTKRDMHPGRDEPGDETGRHPLRRQRQQRHAVPRRRQQVEIRLGRRPQHRLVMHPGTFRRQERPLEMDAEHLGHRLGGFIDGGACRAHLVGGVADQGRQQPGGAEAPMRRDDRGDPRGGRRVVEQHIAAAIDLGIDKARCEPASCRHVMHRHPGRNLRARHQADDIRARDQHRSIAMNACPVEHGVGGDRVPHRVRVTLRRWRGRSGSIPSRAARRTIIA